MTECFYCARPLYARAETRVGGIIDKLIPMIKALDRPIITLDHLVPRSRTKGLENGNTVPCCAECNHAKRDLTLEEYRVLCAFRYGYISGVTWKFPGEEAEEARLAKLDSQAPALTNGAAAEVLSGIKWRKV